jgi:hypothetical protein
MIEPTLSLIVTFGGLWMMWHGITWVKYLIMISGILMHLSIVCIVLVLLKELLLTKTS